MRKTISLCMIVKNEEKFLDRCLSSVKGKVDEIIIIDTGSTDKTKEIAHLFNAQVFDLEWNDDFSYARNASIEKATSEYILVLDADEYLDETCNIQNILETEVDHYTVRIKNHLTSGGAIFHLAVRLFKNNRGLNYFGKIHEHLNVEDKSLNLTHQFANMLINHEGYKEEIVIEKKKHERNIKLLLEEVENNPSGYNYYNLGTQYKANHEYEKAIDAYQIAYPLSKDRLYVKTLLYNMIDCLRQLKRYEDALNVVDASIESFPNYTDFYFLKGKIYEELNYFIDAERAYKQCLKLGEVKLFQTLEGVGSFLSCVRLGSIYIKQGKNLDAFDMAIDALNYNKHHMPALMMYFQVVQKTKIPNDQVKEHLQTIYPIQNTDDIRNLVIVMTVSKSPLLTHYIDLYKLTVDDSVLAISKLYAKDYKGAFSLWSKYNEIENSQAKDIILLSYLLIKDQLLDKCKNHFNLRAKEWKLLKKIVNKEEIEPSQISMELEEILIFLVERLIYMNEEKNLKYLLNILSSSSSSTFKLAEVLHTNTLTQLAQNILLDSYKENANNLKVVELLADTCVKQKQFIEALSFYDRAINLESKYQLYEKVYRVYRELNDNEGLRLVESIIKQKYPLSRWIK
ncbi:glycosyltransferase [Bacillus sp. JJ1521]|uniref:glycosyltransferase n=1 Tax=Bacillus sp. JJ1521 TaxID=3122957 RepID=UPI003000DC3E